jgi:hypothetical protein
MLQAGIHVRRGCCASASRGRIQGHVGGKRTRAELIQALAQERQALAASCANYDKGNEWEAARLATVIGNLVFDGGRSIRSVLTQLELRDFIKFVSSGHVVPDPYTVLSTPPLLMARFNVPGAKSGFIPHFSEGVNFHWVQFKTWWDELVFWQKRDSIQLSRMRLIIALRNQDGGSHVGELTDSAYARFKSGAGWYIGGKNRPPEPVANLVSATMRQVAWEVTETLKQLDGSPDVQASGS